MKKWLSFLLMLAMLSQTVLATSYSEMTDEEYAENIPKIHYFQDYPIEEIADSLYTVDARGGTRVDVPNWDFTKRGTSFDLGRYSLTYGTVGGYFGGLVGGKGYYKLGVPSSPSSDRTRLFSGRFEIKPNRQYLVSALVWSEHSRYYKTQNKTREWAMGMYFTDENDNPVHVRNHGMPDWTGDENGKNGWKRIEFVMSPGLLSNAKYGRVQIMTAAFYAGAPESKCLIADCDVYELPEQELVPYQEGEGVTFRGSAGDLDMRVNSALKSGKKIVVNTTGAKYTFDLADDTITAEQKINLKRKVSSWKSSISFSNLALKYYNEKEAVISSPNISFGVQMDGSLFLTPHNNDVTMLCTSEIGGHWNRFGSGFLLSYDDYGGFSVSPDIPEGTGRLARTRVVTEGLDFTELYFENNVENYDKPLDTFISNEKPGWQIEWTVSPGERLCIGTFPPREMEWDKFFDYKQRTAYPSSTYVNLMDTFANEEDIGIVLLWDFAHTTSMGMTFGPYYQHDVCEGVTKEITNKAHNLGMKVIDFTSMHFYYDRSSPDTYIKEVKRLKERYNLDGIYSDGTPGESNWIVAYEEARMLRELFPDGIIDVHQTGQPNNGGAPLSASAFSLPNLDTYYSATLKGENVKVSGYDAPLVYMTYNQYNLANNVGKDKADMWTVEVEIEDTEEPEDTEGEEGTENTEGTAGAEDTEDAETTQTVAVSGKVANLINLIQGGRPRYSDAEFWKNTFLPMNDTLRACWEENKDEPYFYEAYYAPLARELAHEHLAEIGDIYVIDEEFEDEAFFEECKLTNAETKIFHRRCGKGAGEIRTIEGSDSASLFKRTMSLSGDVVIEFDMRALEAGEYEYRLSDDYGTHGITLQVSRDNKLKIKNESGEYETLSEFKRNMWYKFQLRIDTDTHEFTLYQDANRLINKGKLDETFFYLSNHEFVANGYGSAFCIDHFKVRFAY